MNPVIRILDELFDPTGTQIPIFRDCILISLDAEYSIQKPQISQLGLASLDTREIHRADADSNDWIKQILPSRLLLLQKQSRKKGPYLFNDPEKHYGENLKDLLHPVFTIMDSITSVLRNIVLVGHSIRNDIREIQRSCGLDLLALPTIKAVIDTSMLTYQVFHTSQRCHTLTQMCQVLGMYRRNVHTAGNDAMYTLKALLLIFCHYKEEKLHWDFDGEITDQALLYCCQVEALRRIGRCKNGRVRFHKQREKRAARIGFRAQKDKSHIADILDHLTTEEALMDDLFTS